MTPTGTLNVRVSPSLSAEVLTKAVPGEEYEVLADQDGWAQITLKNAVEMNGHNYSSGWVSEQYVKFDVK